MTELEKEREGEIKGRGEIIKQYKGDSIISGILGGGGGE